MEVENQTFLLLSWPAIEFSIHRGKSWQGLQVFWKTLAFINCTYRINSGSLIHESTGNYWHKTEEEEEEGNWASQHQHPSYLTELHLYPSWPKTVFTAHAYCMSSSTDRDIFLRTAHLPPYLCFCCLLYPEPFFYLLSQDFSKATLLSREH